MMDAALFRRIATVAASAPIYPDPRFPPSVYYRFLYKLAEHMEPKVSVELGLCGGGASLHLALGCETGLVIGVDVSNDWPENVQHVQDTCPNFRFWRMDSIDAVVHFVRTVRSTVDILFIDTVHTYQRTMAEFDAWRPLLSPTAVVLLDDLFREGMNKVWAELPGYKLRMDKLHIGGSRTDGGFGVLYGIK